MNTTFVRTAFVALVFTLATSVGIPIMVDVAQAAKGQPVATSESDNRLADSVRQALQQAGFVNEAVMVGAKDGTITLTGSVLGNDRVAECEQTVRRVAGVKHVDNQLTFPSIYTDGNR